MRTQHAAVNIDEEIKKIERRDKKRRRSEDSAEEADTVVRAIKRA